MGLLRGVMAVGVLVALSGCGAYDDFKANNAVQEYRQNCFGNYTNECESKLVDTNIIMLELARRNVAREKDTLIKAVGQDGYERFAKAANEVIDDLVDRQEKKRPGIFARWVLGDAQPFGDTRNQLFLESDMLALRAAVLKKISDSNPVAQRQAITEHVATAPVEPPPAAPDAAAAALLNAAIDREIASEIAQDGGDEYKDARQIILTDLNGDGTNDAVVLYTLEGQGGGNGYFQSLATFYATPQGWIHRAKLVVGSGVQSVEVIAPQTLAVKMLSVGPDDANCCPSVESTQKFTWNGTTFLQSPGT